MNPIKKLLQHTAIYGLSSIVGRLLNYLLVPLYTAVFLPEEYGVVTELYAYTGFLMAFLTFGMETGFFRFANKVENWKGVYSTLQFFLLALSGVFLTLVLSFKETLANAFDYGGQSHFLVFLAFIVVMDAVTALPYARLRFQNKALRFATIRFLNIGINIGFNLLFIMLLPYLFASGFESLSWISKPKIDYIFWSNIIASGTALLLLFPELKDVESKFDRPLFKKIFAYSLPLLIMSLAGMINETFDRAILKHLIVVPEGHPDPQKYVMYQLGIYGANYKLSILMTLFIQAFRYAAEPFFFSQAKEKGADELYGRVMNYFIAFGVLIFLGIMFYLDIVKYFIDKSYHEGLAVVPILLMANLFLGIVYNLSIWYKLSDRTQIGMWIGLLGALLTIVLNMAFVPVWGYLGAAWATLACYGVMALVSYVLSRIYYPIPYNLKKTFALFTLAGLGFGLTLWSETLSFGLKMALHTGSLLIYLVLMVMLFKADLLKKVKLGK